MSFLSDSIIISIFFLIFLYFIFPRGFNCLSIALALTLWGSDHMTYKQVVDSCTDGNKGWTVDERCEAAVWILVLQVLVTMVGVMSGIAEMEGIIGRMRMKRVEGKSIDEKATGGKRA
ncbi:hypothetical protein M438DRAFT_348745 [Aureobasidium pullulans EXF-150]|uniref:Uncharacterized protein n=1 Tax=Aureobasidium pullulans EXF-150 TaxID=1043002 RepID=A0A074X9W1_AURPU|nr:uncharacterized protein M438DRAFT_348745 [Aureobasidium pullulans EXF-150]KEQ80514.1 hypothetical protein M438DRAFT_348745 [Aureobasidium pullulans EXF-150]